MTGKQQDGSQKNTDPQPIDKPTCEGWGPVQPMQPNADRQQEKQDSPGEDEESSSPKEIR